MNLLYYSGGIFILFSIVPVQVVSSGCPFEVDWDSDTTQMFHPVTFLILLQPFQTSLQALRQTIREINDESFQEPSVLLQAFATTTTIQQNTEQAQEGVLVYMETNYFSIWYYVSIFLIFYSSLTFSFVGQLKFLL